MKKLTLYAFLVFMFCNISFSDSLIVVDGDTIVLNGEKIRFSGIDTPELKQMCMNGDEKVFCGKSAKMLLVKKIGNQTPECIREGKDAYKRTLAECFINGESLSIFLVRSGYAFAYRKYSDKFVKGKLDYYKLDNRLPKFKRYPK